MFDTLRVAAAGAEAQQRALDVAANNLANAQTAGYKARRADLVDLPPAPVTFIVSSPSAGVVQETAAVGQGAAIVGVHTNQAAGPAIRTGQPLDVAIVGQGFIPVSLADGRVGYTRDGALRLDAQGQIVTSSGAPVAPPVQVPGAASGVSIESDGRVTARFGTGDRQEIGQLRLARFTNPDGLESVGGNVLVETPASGAPIVGTPGTDGLGRLEPSSLEVSNVDVAEELVRTMQAQRAYQVSLRAVHTLDEMLQDANSLRR